MTTGRLVGDWFVHRFGVVRLIRAAGVISTIGLLAALIALAAPALGWRGGRSRSG